MKMSEDMRKNPALIVSIVSIVACLAILTFVNIQVSRLDEKIDKTWRYGSYSYDGRGIDELPPIPSSTPTSTPTATPTPTATILSLIHI